MSNYSSICVPIDFYEQIGVLDIALRLSTKNPFPLYLDRGYNNPLPHATMPATTPSIEGERFLYRNVLLLDKIRWLGPHAT